MKPEQARVVYEKSAETLTLIISAMERLLGGGLLLSGMAPVLEKAGLADAAADLTNDLAEIAQGVALLAYALELFRRLASDGPPDAAEALGEPAADDEATFAPIFDTSVRTLNGTACVRLSLRDQTGRTMAYTNLVLPDVGRLALDLALIVAPPIDTGGSGVLH